MCVSAARQLLLIHCRACKPCIFLYFAIHTVLSAPNIPTVLFTTAEKACGSADFLFSLAGSSGCCTVPQTNTCHLCAVYGHVCLVLKGRCGEAGRSAGRGGLCGGSYAAVTGSTFLTDVNGETALALGALGGHGGLCGAGSLGKTTVSRLGCGIAGSALFAFAAGSAPAFYASALLFGVYYGITNVMMPLFTRRAFGDAEYAQIYSRVSMVASISNVIGGFVWGTLVSVTGSYVVMFVGAIALMVITCAVVLVMSRMKA